MAESIVDWLDGLGLKKYADVFEENDIDTDVVCDLSDADLQELGISLGDRKRLLRAIDALRRHQRGGEPTVGAASGIASRQIDRRSAEEGEHKQVTLLFADIADSTALIDSMEAEAAAELLRAAIDQMMHSVRKFGGTVNKILGDGIMAIFGAPAAHEDHAVRACYAALDMLAGVGTGEADKDGRPARPPVRVGLNSGDVVVRAIHNDLTMDYDAVGPTVHLAGRMEQLAPAGQCRMTASTFRLAEGYVAAKSLGPVTVRGVNRAITVYELVSATDFRSRFLARQRGRLTRFVGRDAEMAALHEAWRRAAAGMGESLSIVGEAGLGKSRIFHQFLQDASMRNVPVLATGAVAHASGHPFFPLISLIKSQFAITDSDDAERIEAKVRARLGETPGDSRGTADAILGLLDLRTDPEWSAMEPALRRKAILNACMAWVLSEAEREPIVFVFEDLHWIDAETKAFLDLFVERLGEAPILLLLNHRPEFDAPWAGKAHHRSVRMDPLPLASGRQMLADLLGEDPELDPLRDVLMERTDGNPFYVEESVQALIEMGYLRSEGQGLRLAVPVSEIVVPPTITAIVDARIDRLRPDAKRLLQTAAVIGKDFEFTLLSEVAGLDPATLQDCLSILKDGEFVYETRLYPEPEYSFKHALTHQVAYDGLLGERRRAHHADVLGAIDRLDQEHGSDRLEQRLFHAVHGEVWEKAYAYGMSLGQRALAMSASASAIEAFDHAAAALARLPETEKHLNDAIDCRLNARAALYVLGGSSRMESLMEEARALAARLGNRRRLAEVILHQSGNDWMYGKFESAITLAEEASTIAREIGDERLEGLASYRISTAALLSGDYAAAAESALAAAAILRPIAAAFMRFGGFVYTMNGSFGSVALSELGRLDEATALGRDAYELAVEKKHAYSISVGCFGIGQALAERGDFEAAAAPLEEGLRQIAVHSVAATIPWVTSRAAYVYAALGRWDQMDAMLDMGWAQDAGQLTVSMMHPSANVWAARACIAAGRIDAARRFGALAVRTDRAAAPDPGVRAWALWIDAKCALAEGQGNVTDKLRRLADDAERSDLRILRLHCLQDLAEATGSHEITAEARELSRQLGLLRCAAVED